MGPTWGLKQPTTATGPPDLSGPSLSEAYRKPGKNNKPAAAGAWGGKQPAAMPPVQRQVWETQEPPTAAGELPVWDTAAAAAAAAEIPPQIWETQSNSSMGSEASVGRRDLVAELAASMRGGMEEEDPVVEPQSVSTSGPMGGASSSGGGVKQPPLSQGIDWLPNPPPQPDVDWQAQAVTAQQQVMQFSAAMHRMQSQVQTYASFTAELQSQLANEAQQLAAQQQRNQELQAQLEAAGSSGGGESAGSSDAVDQLRQESDLMSLLDRLLS